jgi:hypothetical protein
VIPPGSANPWHALAGSGKLTCGSRAQSACTSPRNAYRSIVNQMLVLSRGGRRDDALQIYGNSSRLAYIAASDTLGQLGVEQTNAALPDFEDD